MKAVHRGQHSRFHRHLQRVAGSKTMAELICFTGCADIKFLRETYSRVYRPAVDLSTRENNGRLRMNAAKAKHRLRMAEHLSRKLDSGALNDGDLTQEEHRLLRDLRSGTLREQANDAAQAYGHGTLRTDQGTRPIGGSTGGRAREMIDCWERARPADFYG